MKKHFNLYVQVWTSWYFFMELSGEHGVLYSFPFSYVQYIPTLYFHQNRINFKLNTNTKPKHTPKPISHHTNAVTFGQLLTGLNALVYGNYRSVKKIQLHSLINYTNANYNGNIIVDFSLNHKRRKVNWEHYCQTF